MLRVQEFAARRETHSRLYKRGSGNGREKLARKTERFAPDEGGRPRQHKKNNRHSSGGENTTAQATGQQGAVPWDSVNCQPLYISALAYELVPQFSAMWAGFLILSRQ